MKATIIVAGIFFIGLSLGYSGISVKEVSKILQHYAAEGDDLIQEELVKLEKKRVLRRETITKQREKISKKIEEKVSDKIGEILDDEF
jgi:hypothetical protein